MNGRRVPKAREWSSTATVARSATSAATTSARRSGSAAFTLKKSAFAPASPCTAGVVALMMAANPALPPAQIEALDRSRGASEDRPIVTCVHVREAACGGFQFG